MRITEELTEAVREAVCPTTEGHEVVERVWDEVAAPSMAGVALSHVISVMLLTISLESAPESRSTS